MDRAADPRIRSVHRSSRTRQVRRLDRRYARLCFLRPGVEPLEDRSLLTTFIVGTTADSGPGSLRQAILDANATAGADTIAFNIPTSDPGYIDVDSGLAGGDATR
jgi:hypothetical protein